MSNHWVVIVGLRLMSCNAFAVVTLREMGWCLLVTTSSGVGTAAIGLVISRYALIVK